MQGQRQPTDGAGLGALEEQMTKERAWHLQVNSPNSQPLQAYDGHGGNVTAVGFQKDSKWMFRCALGAAFWSCGAGGPSEVCIDIGIRSAEVLVCAGTRRAASVIVICFGHAAPRVSLCRLMPSQRLRRRDGQDLGPPGAGPAARVREPRHGQHRRPAPQPGRAHLGCGPRPCVSRTRGRVGCTVGTAGPGQPSVLLTAVSPQRSISKPGCVKDRMVPSTCHRVMLAPYTGPRSGWVMSFGMERRTHVLSQSRSFSSAGDSLGNIRVWDLTAGACSCELVPEVGTAVRSLSVALDGSMVRMTGCPSSHSARNITDIDTASWAVAPDRVKGDALFVANAVVSPVCYPSFPHVSRTEGERTNTCCNRCCLHMLRIIWRRADGLSTSGGSAWQVVAANNAGTCYVWRMMRGATASTHFEPLHKLKAHSRALLLCMMTDELFFRIWPAPLQHGRAVLPMNIRAQKASLCRGPV